MTGHFRMLSSTCANGIVPVIEFLQQEEGAFAPASTLGDAPATTTQTGDAAGGAAVGGKPQGSPLDGIWVLGLMFLVIWMFLIRPERKRQKQAQEMREALKKGDQVVTVGGMHGKIAALDEATITLEVADKVRIKFNRNAVAHPASSKKEDSPTVVEKTAE